MAKHHSNNGVTREEVAQMIEQAAGGAGNPFSAYKLHIPAVRSLDGGAHHILDLPERASWAAVLHHGTANGCITVLLGDRVRVQWSRGRAEGVMVLYLPEQGKEPAQ